MVASIQAPVAPVWRHWLEPHRAAFEHGLQPVDAPITLSQTLGPTEAIGRTIAHAKLFEAEPAAWRVIDEPELSASGSALRATKIGPRAAVRELRVGDTDEFGLLAERYQGPLVLKPDHARGPEARYTDAHDFVEEGAVVRVASAFRHELKATLVRYLCGITIPHASAHRYLQGWGEFPVIRRLRGNAKVTKRAEG